MNCTMISNLNHAHTCTHEPPSPLGEPESKKKDFVAPIVKFPSADISKTINMLSKHAWYNQCHNTIKMKWYKY